MVKNIENISRATSKVGRRDDAKLLKNSKKEDNSLGAKGNTFEDKIDNFMNSISDKIVKQEKAQPKNY